MNPKQILPHAIPAVVVAMLSMASVPAFAAVDCANPKGVAQARACAMAQQGPDSLRRFAQRTAPIYLVSFADYAKYLPQAQEAPATVASAAQPAK